MAALQTARPRQPSCKIRIQGWHPISDSGFPLISSSLYLPPRYSHAPCIGRFQDRPRFWQSFRRAGFIVERWFEETPGRDRSTMSRLVFFLGRGSSSTMDNGLAHGVLPFQCRRVAPTLEQRAYRCEEGTLQAAVPATLEVDTNRVTVALHACQSRMYRRGAVKFPSLQAQKAKHQTAKCPLYPLAQMCQCPNVQMSKCLHAISTAVLDRVFSHAPVYFSLERYDTDPAPTRNPNV